MDVIIKYWPIIVGLIVVIGVAAFTLRRRQRPNLKIVGGGSPQQEQPKNPQEM